MRRTALRRASHCERKVSAGSQTDPERARRKLAHALFRVAGYPSCPPFYCDASPRVRPGRPILAGMNTRLTPIPLRPDHGARQRASVEAFTRAVTARALAVIESGAA